jgi:2-keto-4-pentenoate hydratase/2-oxohepta-3-ene-1,7-dioic acid hydratase in catechol pathway
MQIRILHPIQGSGTLAAVRLVTFAVDGRASVGVLSGVRVVDLGSLLGPTCPQPMLTTLIDGFDELAATFDRSIDALAQFALRDVTLLPSVPAPGKVLCVMRNRPASDDAAPPYAYLKHADGAVGSGQALRLPPGEESLRFEPELAVVVRGPARHVDERDWRDAVFGYTGFLDVVRPPSGFPPGPDVDDWWKSWDTPYALGPSLVTADEVPDPGRGLTLRATTAAADPGRPALAQIIAFLSSVMTLHSGDVIACGAHRAAVVGASAQGGVELELPSIGTLSVAVTS